MPALLLRHKVTHYAAWKQVFDEQDATRRTHGCQRNRLFQSAAEPNELLILLEWDDLDRAHLFAISDDLLDLLKRAEVADEPNVWVLVELGQAVADGIHTDSGASEGAGQRGSRMFWTSAMPPES